MEVVHPVKSRRKVEAIWNTLYARNPRDALLWRLGINVGVRVSDQLRIRLEDVYDFDRGEPHVHLRIRDQKTGKTTTRRLTPILRRDLQEYIESLADDATPRRYLFQSAQGPGLPITRSRAYQILKEAALANGLRMIGTHTMRKTLGYHMYRQTKDIVLVQKLLNHSDSRHTLRYIGMDQDEQDQAMKEFGL